MTFDPDQLAADLLNGATVPANGQDAPDDLDPTAHLLGLRPVGVIAAEVDAMGQPVYLFEDVWPSDAHGVIGAVAKCGKTWLSIDAAVSVASGTPWLGQFPTGLTGSVVLFLGEGGKRKMTRRGRAVADARGVEWDDLPIVLAERVPRLSNEKQINALRVELDRHPAALIVIDPLYLAAAGAKASQLYDMATVLEPVQVACQEAGSALMLVHHFNRDSTKKGAERMSGAGPAEWGRVLVTVEREALAVDPVTKRSEAVLKLSFDGDEIPETVRKIRRRVWADDPADLGSPLHYVVEAMPDIAAGREWNGPTECMEAVTRLFRILGPGEEMTTRVLLDQIRAMGRSYRDETVRESAERLVMDDVLSVRVGPRKARMYRLIDADSGQI